MSESATFKWPDTRLETSRWSDKPTERYDIPTQTIKERAEHRNNTEFKSSAEHRMARLLDFLSIRWEYEASTFTLKTGEQYTPDFWLPDVGTFIEVKSGSQPERLHKPTLLAEELCQEHYRRYPDTDSWYQERLQVLLVHDHHMYHSAAGRTCCEIDAVPGHVGWCRDNSLVGGSYANCSRCRRWAPWDELNGWQCRNCGLKGKEARTGDLLWEHEELWFLLETVTNDDDLMRTLWYGGSRGLYETAYWILRNQLHRSR